MAAAAVAKLVATAVATADGYPLKEVEKSCASTSATATAPSSGEEASPDSDAEAGQDDAAGEDQRDIEEALGDLKIAVIGNVDSGKSTLVGVLTKGLLDDGRGKARSMVFNFSHEAANGRTSSIAQEIMGFQEGGKQVMPERTGVANLSAAAKNAAWQQIVGQSEKLITFVDLCGHERYLKTTIFGLVGLCPDYAMIVVNANAGFQRMSREHLGIALALHIPIFIVVTKTDVAPTNVFEENVAMLQKMVKSKAVNRPAIMMTSEADLHGAIEGITADAVTPLFCVSSVTGEGLDLLRCFLQQMRSRVMLNGLFKAPTEPVEFHVDSVYLVPGVGVVASGIMRGGRVGLNQTLYLGPDSTGQYKPVAVKSIHRKRVMVDSVESGQACTFALRSLVKKDTLKKSSFRKGMVLVDQSLADRSVMWFRAEVVILHHATTIRTGYQAFLHCGVVRQAARVVSMSEDLLRTGDKSVVTFRFLYNGEFLVPGAVLLFREGRTKGLGRVVECLDDTSALEADYKRELIKPSARSVEEADA